VDVPAHIIRYASLAESWDPKRTRTCRKQQTEQNVALRLALGRTFPLSRSQWCGRGAARLYLGIDVDARLAGAWDGPDRR
jgi:hypothetical protein